MRHLSVKPKFGSWSIERVSFLGPVPVAVLGQPLIKAGVIDRPVWYWHWSAPVTNTLAMTGEKQIGR